MFAQANMLVLKLTRDCNLRCEYCYIRHKDDYRGERIDFDLYKDIINRIIKDRLKAETNNQKFSIIFHGGEPLLMDLDQLSRMFEYARKKFIENDVSHEFGIQSNLTLLTPDLCKLLHEYDVSVGMSFDGFANGSFARSKILDDEFFKAKIALMDEYGVRWGPLLVANSSNYQKIVKSVDYLKREYDAKAIKVNYVEDVNTIDQGSEITGREFINNSFIPFITDFINGKPMIESNTFMLLEKFFKHSLYVFEDTARSNCYTKFCGGGISIVEMEPSGKVFLCGRYSENYEEAYIENARDKDFLDLIQIGKYIDFAYKKHKIILETGCDICPARHICDHGCMAFHMSKYGTYGIRKGLVCEIFKPTYDFLVKNESKIFRVFLEKIANKEINVYFDPKNKHIFRGGHNKVLNDYLISIDEKNGELLVVRKEKK